MLSQKNGVALFSMYNGALGPYILQINRSQGDGNLSSIKKVEDLGKPLQLGGESYWLFFSSLLQELMKQLNIIQVSGESYLCFLVTT